MFTVTACKVKQNAPRCHTFLEIVYARYGPATHVVFIFFALATNILVASQLLLGGSAVVSTLTGMNVYAACWLIPVGVALYVVLGGLRATFLCDFSHTIIILIIILYFMFDVYARSPLIGSPQAMYDLLKQASIERPVDGNQDGSYLTLKSNFGLVFAVVQLCSGMGTVFLDQGYWQRAIASRPTTAVRAYILGGFAWFAIPFGFATTLGLSAVALTSNPAYPTFPDNMTTRQVQSGLAAPFAAQTLLGPGGAVALLLTLFMAVTSSSSSELIAVSSILTFDIYKTYFKPNASGQQLIFVSHIMICFFAAVMAIFACIWNAVGIDLGWLFLVMGTIFGGGVMPAAFTVVWKGQTRAGAISGCLCGLAAGIISWLVTAKAYYGELTIETTGSPYPTLAGNSASFMVGLIVSFVVSIIKPDDFDWSITRAINQDTSDGVPVVNGLQEQTKTSETTDEKKGVERESGQQTDREAEVPNTPSSPASDDGQVADKEQLEDQRFLESPVALRKAYLLALVLSIILTVLMCFLVPMPMFFSHYIFSQQFFTAWVVISFIWVFAALMICGILPIWETRAFWMALFRDIFLTKKQS
ncbi:hypothetical protein N0V93_008024 [Gnomoniopsis smithogilvyi]|uniref:Urea transporter n=1 Tax=Gnomoniopsis smithogilvyi TaxID=1191159 RepID=A0A9W8YPI8_9PEZI|nr:hypothetical protein N0V93_008024 [Gnomoniopsis smithogilvyi]